jgi:hypothetical protein
MIKNIIILLLVAIIGYSYMTGTPVKRIINDIERQVNDTGIKIQSPVTLKES